jgi:protein-disulfide isomerase
VRTGKVKIQWHAFTVFGPMSVSGERFIAAAGLQSHLWDVLDDVMANQGPENSGWLGIPLLERIGASIEGFDVEAAKVAISSPAIVQQVATNTRAGLRHGFDGVPSFLYGPSSGPLKPLPFAALTPADFEHPINRLLRRIDPQ